MNIKINWDVAFNVLSYKMVEELSRRCPVSSGELRASISAKVIGNELHIYGLDYWEWVERGTPPHMPPVDALKEWCKVHWGDENLAWALANHIRIYGTKPTWFVRDMLEQELVNLIVESLKIPGAIEVSF